MKGVISIVSFIFFAVVDSGGNNFYLLMDQIIYFIL